MTIWYPVVRSGDMAPGSLPIQATVDACRTASFWGYVQLHTLIGLYLLEFWVIRPRVAGLLGVDETRNFGVPDIWVILIFTSLLMSVVGRSCVRRVWRLFGPILTVFFIGGWLPLVLSFGGLPVVVSRAFWATGQIAFSFLVLGPVLLRLMELVGANRVLIAYASWIGLAGALSITDRLGLTSFNNLDYYRQTNPLLGVNGFYVVGALIPALLLAIFRSLERKRWLRAVLVCSMLLLMHGGLALSGVRTGLLLALLGWLAGALLIFKLIRFRMIDFGGLVAAGVLLLTTAWFIAGTEIGQRTFTLEIFIQRSEESQGLFTDDGRIYMFRRTLSELADSLRWLSGSGINQWTVANPGMEIIHNTYLMAWWECGLLGLLAWVALYTVPLILLGRGRRSRGNELRLAQSRFSARFIIIALMIGGLFYPIGYARTDWLLFLAATLVVLLDFRDNSAVVFHTDS